MADNKKSVLLYCDIIHTVKELTDEEAGKLFKHYLEYINDLNPTPPDKLTQIVFEPIKQNLKRDLLKWKSKSQRNSEIAKEGWQKRKDANACESINNYAKDADTVTVTVTDKDTVTDTVKVKDTVIQSIEQRKINFSLSLNPFLEKYIPEFGLNESKDMLNKFYVYWSESNPNGKKMKWEMQKTWDLKGRLRTWADNQIRFNKNNNNGTKQGSTGSRKADIIALNKLSSNVLQQFEFNEDSGGNTE